MLTGASPWYDNLSIDLEGAVDTVLRCQVIDNSIYHRQPSTKSLTMNKKRVIRSLTLGDGPRH